MSQILQQLLMFVVLILFSAIPLLSVSPFFQSLPNLYESNTFLRKLAFLVFFIIMHH